MAFGWEGGRKLTSFSTPNAVGNYVYNSDGIRVYKEVNGNTTEYYLNGTQIETEITNFGGITRRVDYIYDENGSIYGFVVDNTAKYYYTKNLQGDVIGILDASGTQIVEYSYDAWGKATVSYPNNENLTEAQKQANYLLGSNNPFRYRGYYFDNETGFYYLNSRYYDPETGRFINADGAYDTNQGVLGYNMYAYCLNNPINKGDPCGHCGRFLGFLWKIDCKSSTCQTSKSYVKPSPPVNSAGTYNDKKGNPLGNVYVIQSSQLDDMNKAKEKNDVIVIDNRTASNPTMQVRDSHKISNKDHQKQICEIMCSYNTSNSVESTWNRTVDSMLIEWKAHNDGYRFRLLISILKENASERLRHVDFDNEAEGLEYWDYLGK